MKVFPCGTLVWLKFTKDELNAKITAIEIRFTTVTYQITYFYGGELKSIWLSEEQFTTLKKHNKITIGYKSNK